MSVNLRKDPRDLLPGFIDWFEEPFFTLRPYLGQAIRIEDYTEDGHYMIRAEVPGIDPEKDLEVTVVHGCLVISAHRSGSAEDKHRSEFRYGSVGRAIQLPAGADSDDVAAEYDHGLLTVKVGLKTEQKGQAKQIRVTSGK